MKAITVGCVAQKFFMNLYKHCSSQWKILFLKQIIKTTNSVKKAFLSGFVSYHQDFLSDPYRYKMLSNRFYKSFTSTKLITSINSTIKMYRLQKNGLFWCIIIEYSWRIWFLWTFMHYRKKTLLINGFFYLFITYRYEMWRTMARMMNKILVLCFCEIIHI